MSDYKCIYYLIQLINAHKNASEALSEILAEDRKKNDGRDW